MKKINPWEDIPIPDQEDFEIEFLSFDDFDLTKLFSRKKYKFKRESLQIIADNLENLYHDFERKADDFSYYPISDEEIQYYESILERLNVICKKLEIKLNKKSDEDILSIYLYDSFHHVANEMYRIDE